MAYTTIDGSGLFFNTLTTTGTGNAQAVTGLGFQPDWIWGKRTDGTGHHSLFDSVRGITKGLETTSDNAEFTSTDYYSAFGSDGFTIAAGGAGTGNGNGETGVHWCWKAGTSFSNDASSTGVGTIDSTGSVNTTSGFAILTTTGTGSAGTIAHGLGIAPHWIISKRRDDSRHWKVGHNGNDASAPWTKYLELSNANAVGDYTTWNDTAPSTTVFSVDGSSGTNGGSETYVHYVFAPVKGYSKFGRYVGNSNTDGSFIYTGFRPAWIMVKKINSANDEWNMFDNKRDPHNVMAQRLVANINAANAAGTYVDFLSNGFKWRINNNLANGSGNTYIYMAFAESPFVNSNKVPNNAR